MRFYSVEVIKIRKGEESGMNNKKEKVCVIGRITNVKIDKNTKKVHFVVEIDDEELEKCKEDLLVKSDNKAARVIIKSKKDDRCKLSGLDEFIKCIKLIKHASKDDIELIVDAYGRVLDRNKPQVEQEGLER